MRVGSPPAWREARAPRFLGDLPHGWVASSFVRAMRRLVAWEDREERALVLAAGVPAAWVREVPGVRIDGLPTHWGPITLTMIAPAADCLEVCLEASSSWPPGGVRLHSPLPTPVRGAMADGVRAIVQDGVVRLEAPRRPSSSCTERRPCDVGRARSCRSASRPRRLHILCHLLLDPGPGEPVLGMELRGVSRRP